MSGSVNFSDIGGFDGLPFDHPMGGPAGGALKESGSLGHQERVVSGSVNFSMGGLDELPSDHPMGGPVKGDIYRSSSISRAATGGRVDEKQ